MTMTSKRRTIEALLGQGPVLIHADGRRAGVRVPSMYRTDPALVLRFGHHLTPAIDLVLDDRSISGTLTFRGEPFACVLPWTAIYAAILEGERDGTTWQDDVALFVRRVHPVLGRSAAVRSRARAASRAKFPFGLRR